MKLPSGLTVYSEMPIYEGSHFTWGEATKNCTRHIQDLIINHQIRISAIAIESNIIQMAHYLDRIREKLGNRPLIVNSWYRPQHINRKVGGSSRSRHLFGDAVDFYSNYLHPNVIYKLIDEYHSHRGGLGKYYNFIHLDIRGAKARWIG